MTLISPLGGNVAAQDILIEAEEHFRRTVRVLHGILEEIAKGESNQAKALKPALGEMGKAAQTAFDERAKVEKRIRTQAGCGPHDYALDLDAARDEIRRRLACLRDAAGAGELSE